LGAWPKPINCGNGRKPNDLLECRKQEWIEGLTDKRHGDRQMPSPTAICQEFFAITSSLSLLITFGM
jgi:hypothetical protein